MISNLVKWPKMFAYWVFSFVLVQLESFHVVLCLVTCSVAPLQRLINQRTVVYYAVMPSCNHRSECSCANYICIPHRCTKPFQGKSNKLCWRAALNFFLCCHLFLTANAVERLKQYYVLLLDLYKKFCSSLILIFWFEPGCSAVLCRHIVVNREEGIRYVLDTVEDAQASPCCSIHKWLSNGSFLMRFRMQSINKTPMRSQHI